MAHITTETTAKIRKELNKIAKRYGYKLSVRKNSDNSGLDVAIMEGEITIDEIVGNNTMGRVTYEIFKRNKGLSKKDFINKLDEKIINISYIEKEEAYYLYSYTLKNFINNEIKGLNIRANMSGNVAKFKEEAEEAIKKIGGWYDNSNSQVDYFDKAFYFEIEIGRWDKPFINKANIVEEVEEVEVEIIEEEIIEEEDNNTVKATNIAINELKENNQDFEWYPTTQEMIDVIKEDIKGSRIENKSLLEIGAGDGRVIEALKSEFNEAYAIEKAPIHIKTLHKKGIPIVGTDFMEVSLLNKREGVIFSNPPYSEYKIWVEKIISEAQADYVYLIIPERWKHELKNLIEERGIENRIKTIYRGTFNTKEAERKARANIEIVRIRLKKDRYDDDFKTFKNAKVFNFDKYIFKGNKYKNNIKEEKKALVSGDDIKALVELYNREYNDLIDAYNNIANIREDLLEVLDLNKQSLLESFYNKADGLKREYWTLSLKRLSSINKLLTKNSIDKIWKSIKYREEMDFTESNIYAVILYFLEVANKYKDRQLIEVYEKMFSKRNIRAFKSNKKAFDFNGWEAVKNNTHYYLTNKIVLSEWSNYCEVDYYGNLKLSEKGKELLNDIRAVLATLGYETKDTLGQPYELYKLIPNTEEFIYLVGKNEADNIAIRFKGFKNGNMHINFKKEIMDAFTVEFARLKGWIRSPKEAKEEINIDLNISQRAFKSSVNILKSNIKLIEG